MKEIEIISKVHGLFICTVDDCDYERILKYSWQVLARLGKTNYARTHTSGCRKNRGTILMHRLILNLKIGQVCDHIDGNGLNNCRSNIRVATIAQNAKNYRRPKNNKTGFKGVCVTDGKFRATIMVDKKQKYLGRFGNAIDAAKAYNKAAKENHGEFANLNVV